MKFLILLSVVAAAGAACPNACSGHGTCGESSKCTCQARWVGNDCSQRQCPSGLSWIVGSSNADVPAGGNLGGYHPYAECSNRGSCDRDTGECVCFEGYEGRGCRRTACPNACSGHGYCRYNYEVNSNYAGYSNSAARRYDTQQWDAAKTRQCVCDRGYEGIDCASRICPKGDDPLTQCNGNPGTSINDIQLIEMPASTTGWFSITFQDMYNGVYTTRPINSASGTLATDVESALEELPNFAIPNVTVGAATCASGNMDGTQVCSAYSTVGATVVRVTFVDPANAGKQQKMVVSSPKNTASSTTIAQTTHDTADMQPRFDATTSTITVEHLTELRAANGVTSNDELEEHVECSNRGICDGDAGLCQCFEGFTGEACEQQTTFF